VTYHIRCIDTVQTIIFYTVAN